MWVEVLKKPPDRRFCSITLHPDGSKSESKIDATPQADFYAQIRDIPKDQVVDKSLFSREPPEGYHVETTNVFGLGPRPR